jgi:hypothetical protein
MLNEGNIYSLELLWIVVRYYYTAVRQYHYMVTLFFLFSRFDAYCSPLELKSMLIIGVVLRIRTREHTYCFLELLEKHLFEMVLFILYEYRL